MIVNKFNLPKDSGDISAKCSIQFHVHKEQFSKCCGVVIRSKKHAKVSFSEMYEMRLMRKERR
jgi:hypothetical protein